MSSARGNYIRTVLPLLPLGLSERLQEICNSSLANERVLDNLIRLITGAECSSDAPNDITQDWSDKQNAVLKLLDGLCQKSVTKRQRVEDSLESQTAKRLRLSPSSDSTVPAQNEPPVYSLHAISVTSPIRKKMDIRISKNFLTFVNPSSETNEASIPLATLRRAFIVPTRGRSKPHWTVILLSSDVTERGKGSSTSAQDNPQVIFGLDAIATALFTTTSYDSESKSSTHIIAKGGHTISAIRDFLSHISVPVYEPTITVFKSACPGIGNSAGEGGIPGIEAYRAAKSGSLWFFNEGILWGESKPCEFWSVEDLVSKTEGLKFIGSSGRTCTLILTRDTGAGGEDESERMGDETEFGVVDAREKEGINQWIRQHRHLFGKKDVIQTTKQNGIPFTIHQLEDDSDEDDENFAVDSDDDDDGSVSSSEDSSEHMDDEDAEDDESPSEGEEELNPKNHPLMKPGAMPRMTRAAVEMAVGLVEADMYRANGEDEQVEHDELED